MLSWRNSGSSLPSKAQIVRYQPHGPDSETLRVDLKLKRPWNVIPGQYIYLTIPSVTRHGSGLVQAHPYYIAWIDPDKVDDTITLLVQCRGGFSKDLRNCGLGASAIIDGPYGGAQQLDHFDNILFFASGIGIAAHLLHIQHLLLAHNAKRAQARRIAVVWFLESKGKIASSTVLTPLTKR